MPLAKRSILLFCPCCGGRAEHTAGHTVVHPHKIHCLNITCGLETPDCKTPEIATSIWNRRVERKPPHRASVPKLKLRYPTA